jgi:hypothetical protein
MAHFCRLYRPMASDWRVYDNSESSAMRLVARGRGARVDEVREPTAWQQIDEEGNR